MQITLAVPDKKADSFLDVLRHISYVEILPSDTSCRQSSENNEENLAQKSFTKILGRQSMNSTKPSPDEYNSKRSINLSKNCEVEAWDKFKRESQSDCAVRRHCAALPKIHTAAFVVRCS